jgi:nucleoside-diphosphate-sugar epimerase
MDNLSDNIILFSSEEILVTGGSGLVGKELLKQLSTQGKKIKAIYNKTVLPDFKNDNITSVKCDILDISRLNEFMQGITHVYHCAGVVSHNKKDRDEVYAVNIEGTTNVVNAAINAGVKKLLYVSSVAALGNTKRAHHITEEIVWTKENNRGFYGKSKFLGEMEVWRGTGEGVPAIIVNPSTILGSGDWNMGSTKIFKTAFEEFPWYSEGVTGFVDVRDVARAMILLMDSEIVNQRFILNAENVSFKNLFTEIAYGFGKNPPYKSITPFIAALVWRTAVLKSYFTGKKTLLNKETTEKALSKVFYDNTKIKNYLPGFSFRPISETISDTCKSLVELNNSKAA